MDKTFDNDGFIGASIITDDDFHTPAGLYWMMDGKIFPEIGFAVII